MLTKRLFYVSASILALTIASAVGSCSRSTPNSPPPAIGQTGPKIVGIATIYGAATNNNTGNGQTQVIAVADDGQCYYTSSPGSSWTKGTNVFTP
jgi:hypothetical protein